MGRGARAPPAPPLATALFVVVVNIANEGEKMDSKMVVGRRKLDSITKGKCLLSKVNYHFKHFYDRFPSLLDVCCGLKSILGITKEKPFLA